MDDLTIRDLAVRQTSPHLPDLGLMIGISGRADTRFGVCLTVSEVEHLRDWLTWWLEERRLETQPVEPHTVMAVLERQRQRLLDLCVELIDDGRFTSGIAHGVAALDEVIAVMRP